MHDLRTGAPNENRRRYMKEKKQIQACCRRCQGGADHLILTVLDCRPYHRDDSQGQSRSSVNFAGVCLWYVALIAQFKRLSSFA